MALPTTITGISTAVACAGPFISSTGNVYFFGRSSSATSNLSAMKATDPTTSFSSVATQSFSNEINTIAAYQIGDIIYLGVFAVNTITSCSAWFSSFDMSTDGFGSTGTIQTGFDPTTSGGAGAFGMAVVARSSSSVVYFYNGPRVANMGSSYSHLYYWDSAVGTPTQVTTTGTVNNLLPEACLGTSGRVHFFYQAGGVNTQRSLSSGNVLQTVVSSWVTTASAPWTSLSYDVSGTIKVIAASYGAAAANAPGGSFNSADVPTFTSMGAYTRTGGIVPFSPTAHFVDSYGSSDDLYAMYRINTDQDLYVEKSTDHGATWSASVLAFAGTVSTGAANLSVDGKIYDRGGSFVIPYVVNDGGTLKYNEYVVRVSSVSGTLATTEPTDTTSLSASMSIIGTLATTEPVDTAAISGQVVIAAALGATDAKDTISISGQPVLAAALATTEPTDTASASGKVEWRFSLALTEPVDTASISGQVVIAAALAVTEPTDTASISGQTVISAALGAIELTDTTSISGQVIIAATLGAIEPADTSSISGVVASSGISGTLGVTEPTDAAAFDGVVEWRATLGAIEPVDTASISGQVVIAAALVVTEPTDTTSISGQTIIAAALATTEPTDTTSLGGKVEWLATLAVAEPVDVAAFSGSATWLATLATIEPTDTTSISGQTIMAATLGAVEPVDTTSINGRVEWFATLAVTEPVDTTSISGTVVTGILATLGAVENVDAAVFAGQVVIAATLATVEASDTAALAGQVVISAGLASVEAPDAMVLTGSLADMPDLLFATLAATEAPDTALFFQPISGYLAAVERPDTAARFAVPMYPMAGVLEFGIPRVIIPRRL